MSNRRKLATGAHVVKTRTPDHRCSQRHEPHGAHRFQSAFGVIDCEGRLATIALSEPDERETDEFEAKFRERAESGQAPMILPNGGATVERRLKVSVGYIYDNEQPASFADSWSALLMYDIARVGVLAHEHGRISVRYGTDGLVQARNRVMKEFLRSGSDYLLWVDTDMGFAPESMYQLLAVADPETRPVVGGLCFASREIAHDGMSGFVTIPRPTIFDWVELSTGARHFASRVVYPVNEVVQCAATGAAFILIHRSAVEKVSAMLTGMGHDPETWYDRARGSDGSWLGEDISFCMKLAGAEVPVAVHTGVRTTHYKPMWVSEAHFWQSVTPPPATERTAVIVPVLGRPEHAERFMRSLRASTGLADVYAVCDYDEAPEVVEAWERAGATVLDFHRDQPGSFAQKVNDAYLQTGEPWLFIVGSDVVFHAGWLDHAQYIAETFKADVVGTNDLGNPRVMSGEHATHLLLRRSYVDGQGASWDGPGIVCHEGYRHWYVDDEIVTVAKGRGTFTVALGSRVEHLHPMWGKGTNDAVYELGRSFEGDDGALFAKRSADHV